jgi:hypothetical protein
VRHRAGRSCRSLCENIEKFAIDRYCRNRAGRHRADDTGAHGHAMGFTYNRRLRPAELLITATGDVEESRRAKTFDGYVATVRWLLVSVLTRHTSQER